MDVSGYSQPTFFKIASFMFNSDKWFIFRWTIPYQKNADVSDLTL